MFLLAFLKQQRTNFLISSEILSSLYVFINKSIAQTESSRNVRSYGELLNNSSIMKIDGVFLVDKLHPLITNSVIDLLNKNNNNRYSVIVYDESYPSRSPSILKIFPQIE